MSMLNIYIWKGLNWQADKSETTNQAAGIGFLCA